MKTKALFIGGLSLAFALTACSLDEVVQVRGAEDDGAISFKPVVPYTSRASVTTTDNIDSFSVWAWNEGNEFMDAVTAIRSGSVFTTSPLYFWPNGTVDFYALSPEIVEYGFLNGVEYALIGGEISIDEDDEGGEHWTYTGNVAQATIAEDNIVIDTYIPGAAGEQIDLCYAIAKNQSGGSVPINFRHALSQIVFKARNTNDEMTIKIAGASVCSVYKHGTYTLKGVGSTTTNLPTSDIGTGGLTGTQGVWSTEEHKARFAAGVTVTTLEGIVNENVAITTADGNLMLLPQTVEAWDVLADSHDEGLGAYIRVLCNISEDGSQLWPNTLEEEDYAKDPDKANLQVIDGVEYGEIAIPVDIEWKEGYRYTYNIIFGEGAGYYPPDDPNDDLDGTPILYPVTFNVTVDEFQDADGIDVPTDTDYDFGDGDDGGIKPVDDILPYVTDDNFKEYVLQYDADGDGKVSSAEVEAVTEIECHTATDFAGIEYFTALESFTSYSVETIDLSKNNELTTIVVSAGPNTSDFAPIVSLDLSGNTKLTAIGDHAFYYCTSLEEITFPSSLISIGERAFQECTSLKAVVLPDWFTTLGNYAFDSCSALAEINFPEKLESIGNYAFNKTVLTSVVLPASVTSLGSNVFQSCKSLESADFSKTVLTAMPSSTFYSCSHLTSVTLPDTLTDLGHMTFYSCNRLETITIPSGVTTFGNQTFRSCSAMLTMYCLPTAPPSLGSDTFRSFSSSCVLYVPSGSVSSYTSSWGSYFSSVEAIN